MPTVTELFEGRTENWGEKSSIERPYLVTEALDEEDVLTAIAQNVEYTYRGLYMKTIEIGQRLDETTWRAAVRYGPMEPGDDPEPPEPVTSFDTTGGTQHITQSRGTTPYPQSAPDFEGAIGFDGESVQGVDIVVPVFEWQETHYLTDAQVQAKMGTWYEMTGAINSTTFRDFAPGEVLFRGCSGQRRGTDPDDLWEITFRFGAQKTRSSFAVGGITVTTKRGWDYMWVLYADDVDEDAKARIRKPVAVYVEVVYPEKDLNQLFPS